MSYKLVTICCQVQCRLLFAWIFVNWKWDRWFEERFEALFNALSATDCVIMLVPGLLIAVPFLFFVCRLAVDLPPGGVMTPLTSRARESPWLLFLRFICSQFVEWLKVECSVWIQSDRHGTNRRVQLLNFWIMMPRSTTYVAFKAAKKFLRVQRYYCNRNGSLCTINYQ